MNTKTITRTGLAVALVIVAQFIGKMVPAGAVIFGPFSTNQLITGSLVNLILIVSGAAIGLWPGVTVGVLSAILATLLGVGPIFPLITPAIAVGNALIVLVTWLFFRKSAKPGYTATNLAGVVSGAAVKCAFLWITVPMLFQFIPEIKPPQIAALSIMFSWPQAITGVVGGLLALAVLPALKKAAR